MLTPCAQRYMHLLTKSNLNVNLNSTCGPPHLPAVDESVSQALYLPNLNVYVSYPSPPHNPHHLYRFCLGLLHLLPKI